MIRTYCENAIFQPQNLSQDLSKMNVQNTSCDIAIQDQYPVMDYFAGSKQTCVIEVRSVIIDL